MRRILIALASLSAAALPADAQRTVARGSAECTLSSVATPAGARTPTAAAGIPNAAQRATTTGQPVPAGEYDIVVDVPNLCVDSIRLSVRNLTAHLALDARVANLVRVTAGADIRIEEVDLEIRDVRAEALLLVDLDHVRFIVDDVLAMIDNNPEIVNSLVGTVQTAIGTVGSVAQTALQPGGVVSEAVGLVGQTLGNITQPGGVLSQTVSAAGQTVQRVLGTGGDLLERTLDAAGNRVGERTIGNLLRMQIVDETTNAAGQVVRTVRDAAGGLIQYTLDQAGSIVSARTVQAAR
ncbi:MAG: hypothetical protein ACREK1_07405 [Longimicrobiales bacterium]